MLLTLQNLIFTIDYYRFVMRKPKALITDCTPYTMTFCEKEKRIINKVKAEYLLRTGAVLSIERAVKILIRRNK